MAQCAIGNITSSCSIGDCSSTVQVNTPVLGFAELAFEPQMGVVSCCGGYASTMIGIVQWCYYTELRDPKVQDRLFGLSKRTMVYVPTCDGWLRIYHPLANRSQKPA